MSRYTGPRLKIMRAMGVDLPGLSRKTIADRPNPPGQHGAKAQRKSGFGIQLLEKQKLRFNYGVTEKYLKKMMRDAKSRREQTGNALLELLERRLDNLVFRAGFAPTAVGARQLISHRHILLNGRSINIPSIRIRIGDKISLAGGISGKAAKIPMVMECLQEPVLARPEWIRFDNDTKTAEVARLPDASEVPFPIDMQQVVEYYAVRL